MMCSKNPLFSSSKQLGQTIMLLLFLLYPLGLILHRVTLPVLLLQAVVLFCPCLELMYNAPQCYDPCRYSRQGAVLFLDY